MRAALAQRLKTEIAAHPGRMCYAGDRYQTNSQTHSPLDFGFHLVDEPTTPKLPDGKIKREIPDCVRAPRSFVHRLCAREIP